MPSTLLKDLDADTHDLPWIPEDEVTLLYHSDYYDGPLSGMATYKGEKYWYLFFGTYQRIGRLKTADSWYCYWLVKLTPEQFALEEQIHEDFRRWVGTHCDYGEDGGERNREGLRQEGDWKKFYEKWDVPKEQLRDSYKDNEVIGWFQL